MEPNAVEELMRDDDNNKARQKRQRAK